MCLVLLVSSLLVIGCSKDGEGEEGETTENSVVTYAEGDTYVAPDVNYGGKDFDVFTWQEDREWVLKLNAEASKIDQETYYHLAAVEQELNLNFVTRYEKGDYDNMGNFATKLSVLSGDDGIDLVCQYSLAASVAAQQALYTDLNELDYLKWDAEYWSKDLKATNTVNDKMFWCTGDMTASTIKSMFLFAFNYDMAADYRMGDLYKTVQEGKWTIEKLKTLSATVYSDDNGNEIQDVGDTVGLVIQHYVYYDAFQAGCNLPSIIVNNMGELEINPDLYGERGVDVTNKIKDLLHNNGNGTYAPTKDKAGWNRSIEDGKAVFALYVAESLLSLAQDDVNYGILPIPKYDEDQENYRTCLSMGYSQFSVPVIAPEPNVSAAVLESMAHNGYVSLSRAVFDALQYRYSKRVEDIEGIMYEPGRMLNTVDIFALVRRTVRDNAPISQYYAGGKKNFESGLQEVNFTFS